MKARLAERRRAQRVEPLNRAQVPCRFLGEETGEVSDCKTCTGRVSLKVLACDKFGKCTVLKKADGVKDCCATCRAYEAKPVPGSLSAEPKPIRVAPLDVGWGGELPKPVESFRVTIAIPHINTLPQLRLAMDLWRAQTEFEPYFVIVDTGSPWSVCEELDTKFRGSDCEVHFIRGNAYRHSSAPVSHALDLAQSICRTDYLLHTHADVFPMRRDFLAFMLSQCSPVSPVVGWQMSPRSQTKGSVTKNEWSECVSHTATILHMQTVHRLRLNWSMEAYYARRPHERRNTSGWPDTESSFHLSLRDAGIKPLLLGFEENNERHPLTCAGIVWADHARSFASRKIAGGELAADAGGWMKRAEKEARIRLDSWGFPSVTAD